MLKANLYEAVHIGLLTPKHKLPREPTSCNDRRLSRETVPMLIVPACISEVDPKIRKIIEALCDPLQDTLRPPAEDLPHQGGLVSLPHLVLLSHPQSRPKLKVDQLIGFSDKSASVGKQQQ